VISSLRYLQTPNKSFKQIHLSLVLEAASLNVLASDNGIEVNLTLRSADLGIGVSVKLLALEEVEVDGETPGHDEESKGNDHGALGTDTVGDVSKDDGNDGTSGDGSDDEGGTALGVATETAQTDGEDDGEDAALEEHHNHEESETAPVGSSGAAGVDTDCSGQEDHDRCLVGQKNPARLETDVHKTSSRESTDGEEGLSNGIEVGTLLVSLGSVQVGVGLSKVVDKEGGDGALSTDVTELSGDTPEECVLLLEGLVDEAGSVGHHLGLVGHVGVGNLGNRGEPEDNSEKSNENGNAEVDPLHAGERLAILTDVLEDDERGQNRGDDGTDGLERLGELETELSPLGRTAHSNVGVR
jgi:hypothetical protein